MASRKSKMINGFWVIVLSVVFLVGSCFVYLLILEGVMGTFTVKDLYAAAIGKTSHGRVALLQSTYTKHTHLLQNRDADWVDATLQSWYNFLGANGVNFSVVQDQDLESGRVHPDSFQVLILPSTRSMSDQQIVQVHRFMEQGGSVLATWTPGLYNADGTWRGWRFIEDTFGVHVVRLADAHSGVYQIYESVFPGTVPPGLYALKKKLIAAATVPDSVLAAAEPVEDFPPLQGYIRTGPVDAPAPTGDYVKVEPVEPDPMAPPGTPVETKLTYYTRVRTQDKVTAALTSAAPMDVHRFTLRAGTPLTANIPAGARVAVQLYNPGIRLQVVEQRTQSVGFWYDFSTDEEIEETPFLNSAGIVHGTYGKGRFVYMGFQRDAIGVAGPGSYEGDVLAQLFANTLSHLLREPYGWIRDWPDDYQAGATFVGLAESYPERLRVVADFLSHHGVPATYFLRPETAATQPDLAQYLDQQGAVGLMDSLRLDDQGTVNTQMAYFRQQRRVFEAAGVSPLKGYRPDEAGILSNTTAQALAGTGFSYFSSEWIHPYSIPRVFTYPSNRLVGMSKTTLTDREALAYRPLDMDRPPASVFAEDVQRTLHEGSLYQLVFSSDVLALPAHLHELTRIVEQLKAQDVWLASSEEMAAWWTAKLRLELDVVRRGPARLAVRISNTGKALAHPIRIMVSLGEQVEGVAIRPELTRTPMPDYELRSDQTQLMLRLEPFRAGESRTYHVDLLGVEAQNALSTLLRSITTKEDAP